MKANLTGIPETLFITLRIRALETLRPDAAIKDPDAVKILKKIHFEASSKDKVSKLSQCGTIARTLIFDNIINDFLLKNPESVIVNLGCGLDARCNRLSLKGCQWFDIDVEETIEVRKLFFEEKPSYTMITKSMFDYSWMDSIPQNLPVLFISEGVMMYFSEEANRALLNEITERFASSEIAFDTISRWAVKNHKRHPDVKKYNAPFKWGSDDTHDILRWNDRFSLIKVYYYSDYLKNRWPLAMRLLCMIRTSFKKAFKVVHLRLK